MFANLNVGNIIHILDTKDNFKLYTGQITNITTPRIKQVNYDPYNQQREYIVDIIATVNGEKKEFREVPSNRSIADFGSDVFTLADSKESMNIHIDNLFQVNKAIVDNHDSAKRKMEECQKIKLELNPSLAAEMQRDSAITNLENKVNDLTKQMEKFFATFNNSGEQPKANNIILK